MAKRLSPLYELTPPQADASDPRELRWVSASAGTGKTQVLTARVIRLLLAGVDPASILCLTFTKAGAAEMADRIHERLAHWVRLDDAKLARELKALGEPISDESRETARRLFARVLDATGGGLRIQTIHAFCQSLLAAFPAEAGIAPGFRPMESREEVLLARETLASMLVGAEEGGDTGLIADVQRLSRRMGEQEAEAFLLRCGRAVEAMEALGAAELIEDRLRAFLDIPLGDVEQAIADRCADEMFDMASLQRVRDANSTWGTERTGIPNADNIGDWIASDPAARAGKLIALREIWCKKDGGLRQATAGQTKAEADYADLCARLDECVRALLELRAKAEFAAFAAAGLRAGARFARDYAEAKRRAGLVDFDDLIRLARELLLTPGMGQWVRYKLDQRLDHILVDEAQDTNADQWAIVAALAAEFFEGDPEVEGEARHRTVFAVGDFKQAIFGFQGTSPYAFAAAQLRFGEFAADAGRRMRALSLDKSYRSTPPILTLVDEVLAEIGPEAIGLDQAARAHESGRSSAAGRVTLWRPVFAERSGEVEVAEEGWIGDAELIFARRLARQVRSWLEDELWLPARERALRPEDVLILLRSRGELASLIVARLHEEGVPVAGIDRLTLTDPLAIRDLLAALRFALQPEDDLNLANLLVSPLFGWTQERLYDIARQRQDSLWKALRACGGEEEETLAGLNGILNQADFVTPYRLLEMLLSGPLQARAKLLYRLGEEARDPIEELLNAALQFEAENPPSLQRFLDWFDRGAAEITRDPSAPLDAVRVMTVHGAKGLQSPLVVLADATRDPENIRVRSVGLRLAENGPETPVPVPRKEERIGPLAEAYRAKAREEEEEHWRLLYVALTRAEEHLVIAGSLGPRSKGGAPAKSWHAAVERAMQRLGCDWIEEEAGFGIRELVSEGEGRRSKARQRRIPPESAPPIWLREPAPRESRPPRPLAPSSLGEDKASDPPPDSRQRAAAERGTLLHRLFERLPEIPRERRRMAALAWLEHAAGLGEAAAREALADEALTVIEDPALAAVFGPDALAEAPIAAVVEGVVVAGTADRLLLSDELIRVVDFKTGSRVPAASDAAPAAHLRQMAAYAAALRVIFPGREVEAALLYTSGPKLLLLPDTLLEAYKPRLRDIQ